MKPIRAFSILDSNGKLACWNYRVPVFWLRKFAAEECRDQCFADSKVVAVIISLSKKGKSHDQTERTRSAGIAKRGNGR